MIPSLTNPPAISVIMPVFNGEAFLAEAIRSIQAQTFRDFEFLACDDGSTDHSVEILEKFAREDQRIRVVQNAHVGLEAILNIGIQTAKGEYLARMDADDIALPSRLELQIRYLQQHPEITVLGGQAAFIDEAGKVAGLWQMPLEHLQMDDNHICSRNVSLIHPTVMMRRSAVLKVGGYRVVAKRCMEDVDLWLRLAEMGRVANLPDVVLKYRRNSKSISSRGDAAAEAFIKVAKEARQRRGLTLDAIETPVWVRSSKAESTLVSSTFVQLAEQGSAHLMLGEYSAARWCALKMVLIRPWSRQALGFVRRVFLPI